MALISGVFFPVEQLPPSIRIVSEILPLSYCVALVRPLLAGEVPTQIGLDLFVLALTMVIAFGVARALTCRRLLG